MIVIDSIDHLVLTVKSLQKSITFYTEVLGMKEITFQNGRKALKFGQQKINLHEYRNEIEPKAQKPTPGSADICFICKLPIKEVVFFLIKEKKIPIIEGPIARAGAQGHITSVYINDPDGNLVEVSSYSQ